jgi:hypothetical protein
MYPVNILQAMYYFLSSTAGRTSCIPINPLAYLVCAIYMYIKHAWTDLKLNLEAVLHVQSEFVSMIELSRLVYGAITVESVPDSWQPCD